MNQLQGGSTQGDALLRLGLPGDYNDGRYGDGCYGNRPYGDSGDGGYGDSGDDCNVTHLGLLDLYSFFHHPQ